MTSIFCRLPGVLLVPINAFQLISGRYRARTYGLIDVNDVL